jgi:uncharacterized membrane protein YgcG
MGKIILTETQYKRFKSILIENVINQTLLNEAAYTLDTKKYSLKTNDYSDVSGGKIKIIGGATYTPTQKGNLTAQGEVEYTQSGSRKKTTIIYVCANNKFYVDKDYYDILGNDTTLEGFEKLCETLKKTKKDSYGIQQTGGAVKGYSQQNNYILKSKDGSKTITIPKGTGYTGKKDQKGNDGATFKLGPVSFGWFGCKSKTFFIDKVLYKDEKGFLANNISNAVCGGSSQLKTADQSYEGGGGSGSVSKLGSGSGSASSGGGSSEYSEYI